MSVRLSDSSSVPVARSCGPHLRFGGTFYFTRRIGSTFNLLQAGTIRYLSVSGDNGGRKNHEPNDLRDALRAADVTDDRIALEYGGFRPLESVILAREVFGWVPTHLATTRRSSASS
jgi:vancomycin permeability regulator SanA